MLEAKASVIVAFCLCERRVKVLTITLCHPKHSVMLLMFCRTNKSKTCCSGQITVYFHRLGNLSPTLIQWGSVCIVRVIWVARLCWEHMYSISVTQSHLDQQQCKLQGNSQWVREKSGIAEGEQDMPTSRGFVVIGHAVVVPSPRASKCLYILQFF